MYTHEEDTREIRRFVLGVLNDDNGIDATAFETFAAILPIADPELGAFLHDYIDGAEDRVWVGHEAEGFAQGVRQLLN